MRAAATEAALFVTLSISGAWAQEDLGDRSPGGRREESGGGQPRSDSQPMTGEQRA